MVVLWRNIFVGVPAPRVSPVQCRPPGTAGPGNESEQHRPVVGPEARHSPAIGQLFKQSWSQHTHLVPQDLSFDGYTGMWTESVEQKTKNN